MSVPKEGESIRGARGKPDYKIDETGCWIWQKAKSKAGYPTGREHRLYWAAANGPVPAGWHVHHKCEVTSCVNPDHLEAIDRNEHFMRHKLWAKGMSLDDIREIRRLGSTAFVSTYDIAARYGIAHTLVQNYLKGEHYAELLGEGGPVVVDINRPMCAAPDCDDMVAPTKRRHARYCSAACRRRTFLKTPEQRAKKAERQRQRRARLRQVAPVTRGETR